MTSSMYQFMSSTAEGWLCTISPNSPPSPEERLRRKQDTRTEAAKSKSGTWGPTHSFDSETQDEEKKTELTPAAKSVTRSHGTGSTKSTASPSPTSFDRVWNRANFLKCGDNNVCGETDILWGGGSNSLKCSENDNLPENPAARQSLMDYVQDVCSPCHPRDLNPTMTAAVQEPKLGISPLEPPTTGASGGQPPPKTSTDDGDEQSTTSNQTPAHRRRERHQRRVQKLANTPTAITPIQEPPGVDGEVMGGQAQSETPNTPLDTLEVPKDVAFELERKISELTMRSSYGQATAKIAENRRMAYYAVGRHHRQSGRGGNRRCYFTGKLILSGAPFYAGSVQQGLRTLVVFCLPSSIGLPKDNPSSSPKSVVESLNESTQNSSKRFSLGLGGGLSRGNLLSRKGSRISRLSSVDDMSLSVGEELDPNYGLDRDYLLKVLPNPSQNLLDEMAARFPAQFETLPVQVRSPTCWRLFVKFCFFSGLPIAEGELHYKVRDEIADQYGEEVILSHEVMEAVNETADLVRLPNLKTFKYLHKHYSQQSSKLPKTFFERQSWDVVLPEV